MTTRRTFNVIVPTTGAALRLVTLAPRPGLPHGAAFAAGDYRPLALSPDYKALAGPEGPIARHLGHAIDPHELRLSGSPDGGRSWEAPVALAHLLLAQGWTLSDNADLTLWATGAVDLDLNLLPGDYALTRKVDISHDTLDPTKTIAILPPSSDTQAAKQHLETLVIRTLTPSSLADITNQLSPDSSPAAAPKPKSRLGIITATAAALGIGTLAAFTLLPAAEQEPEPEIEIEAPTEPDPIEQTTQDIDVTPEQAAMPPSITLSEIRAVDGGSCRSALFDPSQRSHQPIEWTPDGFAAIPFDAGLCGIRLSTSDGSAPPAITTTPANAFLTTDSPAGTQDYFLRGGVQNVVYSFPDPLTEAESDPLRHEIFAIDP